MVRPKAVVSWSSGKDSAFALWEVARSGSVEVAGLLTTVTRTFGRVSMHGVREVLLDRQAQALGLPLYKVEIPHPCPNEVYDRAMGATVDRLEASGVEQIVFGDLYLDDIRRYREERLAATRLRPMFPLWHRETGRLARDMIAAGLVAHLVCLDPKSMPRELAGRRYDARLLAELPPTVDPCGENGEFHTFVSAGPMFPGPIPIRVGPSVERDGFLFTDVEPA